MQVCMPSYLFYIPLEILALSSQILRCHFHTKDDKAKGKSNKLFSFSLMGKLQVPLQYKPWLLHCLAELAGISPNVGLLPSKNVMALR